MSQQSNLDEIATAPRFVRQWSPEPLEGYVENLDYGGFMESDEMFRNRIQTALKEKP